MRIICTICLLFLCSYTIGENPCGLMFPREHNGLWGDGGVYIPMDAQLMVYDSTFVKVGAVTRTNTGFIYTTDSGEKFNLGRYNDVEYVGHHRSTFIKSMDSNTDGLYEVLLNWDYNQNIKHFVKIDDVYTSDGEYCTYQELLFEENIPEELHIARNIANIGVNLSSLCLNLREKPSITSRKIACLGTNGLEGMSKMLKMKSNGPWINVRVSYCAPGNIDYGDMDEGGCGGCCCKIKETEYLGWMKAISESGFPNIWYSVTSY